MESVLKPKKRIFVSLTLASAFLGAVFIYLCWRVALPGLAQISSTLPVLFGSVGIVVAIALLAAVSAIVLAILGFPIIKTFYFWAWKAVNMLFPFAVGLGRIFNIPRQRNQEL